MGFFQFLDFKYENFVHILVCMCIYIYIYIYIYTVGKYVCTFVVRNLWPFLCYLRSYEFSLVDCCVDYRPNLQQTSLEN
jgi:hypothetical protein